MINALLLLLIIIGLYKYFDKTVIILAIWWQVLENFIFLNYKFTGICSIFIFLFFMIKVMQNKISWKEYPLKTSILILMFIYLLSIIIEGSYKLGGILDVISIFPIPIAGYYAIKHVKNLWPFLFVNLCIYSVVILTIGFYELYLGHNPILPTLQAIGLGNYSAEQREDYIRYGMYRCQSILIWCSTYGITCGYTAFLLLMLSFYKRLKQNIFSIILACALLCGMFTCGTRSVLISVAITMISYLYQSTFKLKNIILILIVGISLYLYFQEFFDEIILSLTNQESVGGSNSDMRMDQLNIALSEFQKSPIWGNGHGACARLVRKGSGILGAESFLFWVLIDRGIIGLFGSFLLLYNAVKYIIKNNKVLVFMPIGLMIGKITSLFPNIEETYYLFYLFIILRASTEYNLIVKPLKKKK